MSLELVNDKSLKNNLPNTREFVILLDICNLLGPLKEIKTVLSGKSYLTITHLLPAIFNLIYYELPRLHISTHEIQIIKDELIEHLSKRFGFLFETGMFAAITFLDVFYREFEFIEDQKERDFQLKKSRQYILQYFKTHKSLTNLSQTSPSIRQTAVASSSPSPSVSSSASFSTSSSLTYVSCFQDHVVVSPLSSQTQTDEISQYTLNETNNTKLLNDTPTSIYRRKTKNPNFFKKLIDSDKRNPISIDEDELILHAEIENYKYHRFTPLKEDKKRAIQFT